MDSLTPPRRLKRLRKASSTVHSPLTPNPTAHISPPPPLSHSPSQQISPVPQKNLPLNPTAQISPPTLSHSPSQQISSVPQNILLNPTAHISHPLTPNSLNKSDNPLKDPTVDIFPPILDSSQPSNTDKVGQQFKEAKRVLDFNDDSETGFVGLESTDEIKESDEAVRGLEKGDKESITGVLELRDLGNEEGFSDKKTKKKRDRNGVNDNDKSLSKPSKKREQKERQVYLQQLHAESQKLLRETRDATFKPIPVVHKPISSVLEKIRKRKLELLEKNRKRNLEAMEKTIANSSNLSISENNAPFREVITNDDSDNGSPAKKESDKPPEVLQDQTVTCESNSDDSFANELDQASAPLEDENSPSRIVLDEQPMPAFRAPIDDTQDLFCDSPISEGKEDMSSDQNSSPLEEDFTPSLLAMNLKFDSAPPDDISSDEDDNDKENVNPGPDRADNGCSPLKDDPVKAFVDEEAEEEDNSDHDQRFNENEEDDFEDNEDLKDLIATGYDENPVDNDMRIELHQKWLEQQDATGTDKLVQRLKYGSKLKDTGLFGDEEDEVEDLEDDNEDFYNETAKDPLKTSVARINLRKTKQMIPKLFSVINDGYFSDEEEAEKRLTKQRVLEKVEEQFTLVPPAEDENSREVFGLIKKLNIMPDTKKKAKPSSIFDKMLTGAKTNGFSKSSFVGRKGNHSVPSHTKKGTSAVRSFIFGRDDSNSRSSFPVSEDSSDVIMEETRATRNVTTKFCSSQFKVSSQINKSIAGTSIDDSDSLFDMLKRSSVQSTVSTVGITETVFDLFKIPKKSLRIDSIEQRF